MITIKEKCSDLVIQPLSVDQVISLSFVDYDYYCDDKKAFLDIINHCVDTTKINLDETATITKLLTQIFNISFYPDVIINATFIETFNTIFAKKDKTADDIIQLTKFYNLFRYDVSTLLNSRYELSTLSKMSLVDIGTMHFLDFVNSRTYHSATVTITRKAVLIDFNNGFHPVFKTWYDLLNVKPSVGLANDLNTLISSLDTQGQLSKLDLFHPIAGMETLEQRLTPIVTTGTSPFVTQGALDFSNNGITGTGGYVDLKWNPSINGVNYKLDNAAFGIYSKTNIDQNSYDIGHKDASNNTSYMKIRNSNNFEYYLNQDSTRSTYSTTNNSSIGLYSVVRTNAKLISVYKDGIFLKTEDTAVDTAIPNLDMFLLALNNNGIAAGFSSRTISLVYAGSDTINQSTLNAKINDYLTARGLI